MDVKRVAAVNDMSGLGRCSLTVAIPVMSAMGVQVCPLPTAILSAHTGYPDFSFCDFTPYMADYAAAWQRSGARFDAVVTGFLGAAGAADAVRFLFAAQPQAMKIVDPVMGDDGRIYRTYTPALCESVRSLCIGADLITPNLTEACFLAGRSYPAAPPDEAFITDLLASLVRLGARSAVVTGIPSGGGIANAGIDADGVFYDTHERIDAYCSGTGDMFVAITAASLLGGAPLRESVSRAGSFIARALEYTIKEHGSLRDGIIFEPLLGELICMKS